MLDLLHRSQPRDRCQQVEQPVVVDDGLALAVERRQPRPHGLRAVVRPLIQVLAGAGAPRAGPERVRGPVERRLTLPANQPAGEALDQAFIRDFHVQHTVDLATERFQHRTEGDGLLHRPGEAIEEHAALRVRPLQALVEHRNRDFIRHQRATGHELLGAQAKRGPAAEVLAKKIARGDVPDAQFCFDIRGLGPLAGPGRAE